MPSIDRGGIKGESFREVWEGPVEAERQREMNERFEASRPKGFPKFPPLPIRTPWTSLGQAPTAENLENESYRGSA